MYANGWGDQVSDYLGFSWTDTQKSSARIRQGLGLGDMRVFKCPLDKEIPAYKPELIIVSPMELMLTRQIMRNQVYLVIKQLTMTLWAA